jgi:hypothetical protein
MKRIMTPLTIAFCMLLPSAGSAFATGQPGAANGNTCGMTGATLTPGNSVNANGSPFNPNGQAGLVYAGNPGTASAAHSGSPSTAISEYDVACFNFTASHTPP